MRIGILAKLTGTTIAIIRSYETAGLLVCARRKAGFREFAPEALDQAKLILACRSLGWPFSEIRSLMADLKSDRTVQRVRPHLQEISEQLRRLDLLEEKVASGTLMPPPADEAAELIKFGQFSEQTGLSRGTLDSMINGGLLPCVRRESGYRDFAPTAVAHADCVVALRSLSFTIPQTKAALSQPLTPELAEQILASLRQRRISLERLAVLLRGLADSE
ncbi:MAG: MerR family transcriptional regulator [Candidatus Eremiobacteraeota bacterium]|nr:MerR family transcriptional regulator [Candidatus Eremiobacteraeota bacterium]